MNEGISWTEAPQDGMVLISYFSMTGNTKSIAAYTAERSGGDLYKFVLSGSYSDEDPDYNKNERSIRDDKVEECKI